MQQRLVSDHLTVEINTHGAELFSIKDSTGTEYLWQADPKQWARHAPVLFPIVGRLKENKFFYKGKEYTLAQHGFARDREFTLIQKDTDSCTFELRSGPEIKGGYPFDFVFRIKYQLSGNKIKTTYEVINSFSEPLYFSVGAHPGFNCPLLKGETFEDYFLEFENESLVRTELSDGLRRSSKTKMELTEKKLFLSSALFDHDALVFEDQQINRVSLCSSISGSKLILDCNGWPYFGVWTIKGGRSFICLEPWYGIADHEGSDQQLTDKKGIMCLEPSEEFSCSFAISIL